MCVRVYICVYTYVCLEQTFPEKIVFKDERENSKLKELDHLK